jgi:hypothetical protein
MEDLFTKHPQSAEPQSAKKTLPPHSQRLTKDAFDSGIAVLSSYYPTFAPNPTVLQQWRKATQALTPDEFIAAIDTWIADTSTDHSGQVRSKWAPTIGELLETSQHLGARRQFQKTKDRAAEAMGDTPTAAARSMASLYNQPRIKEQLKRGNDIRRAMAAKYRLDYRLPDSYGFLMATLKEAQGAGGLCSKNEAMQLAEGLESKYLPAIAAAAAQTQPSSSIDTPSSEDATEALIGALDTGGI